MYLHTSCMYSTIVNVLRYLAHRLDAAPELLYAVQLLLATRSAGTACKSFSVHKESFQRKVMERHECKSPVSFYSHVGGCACDL